jgi:hypothetical protein
MSTDIWSFVDVGLVRPAEKGWGCWKEGGVKGSEIFLLWNILSTQYQRE